MIKIGDLSLPTAVPADLDGRLAAIMGINAIEAKRLLEGNCIAGIVAKCLTPLLGAAAPPRHELARLIAADGIAKIRKRTLRLYAGALRARKEPPAHGAE